MAAAAVVCRTLSTQVCKSPDGAPMHVSPVRGNVFKPSQWNHGFERAYSSLLKNSCFYKLGFLLEGVLTTRTPLFGLHKKGPRVLEPNRLERRVSELWTKGNDLSNASVSRARMETPDSRALATRKNPTKRTPHV